MCVREDDVLDLFRTIDGVLPVEPSPRPLTLVEAGVDQQAGTLVLENELASGDRARGALEVEDDGHGLPPGKLLVGSPVSCGGNDRRQLL